MKTYIKNLLLIICILVCTSIQSLHSQSLFEKVKNSAREISDKVNKVVEDLQNNNHDNIVHDLKDVSDSYNKSKDEIRSDLIISVARLLKNVPVKDSESGQMITFNEYAKRLVHKYGSSTLVGSDLENDPICFAINLMLDDSYLYNARMFKGKDGSWLSINGYTKKYFLIELK